MLQLIIGIPYLRRRLSLKYYRSSLGAIYKSDGMNWWMFAIWGSAKRWIIYPCVPFGVKEMPEKEAFIEIL